jgi:hypothetical protein
VQSGSVSSLEVCWTKSLDMRPSNGSFSDFLFLLITIRQEALASART